MRVTRRSGATSNVPPGSVDSLIAHPSFRTPADLRGGPRTRLRRPRSGGGVRIRTGVRGFAGPCLTTRPRRQNCKAYNSGSSGLLVLEVVVYRADDRSDDKELEDRPEGRGEEADDREDYPEDQPDEEQDTDCLREDHGPSFVHLHGRRR